MKIISALILTSLCTLCTHASDLKLIVENWSKHDLTIQIKDRTLTFKPNNLPVLVDDLHDAKLRDIHFLLQGKWNTCKGSLSSVFHNLVDWNSLRGKDFECPDTLPDTTIHIYKLREFPWPFSELVPLAWHHDYHHDKKDQGIYVIELWDGERPDDKIGQFSPTRLAVCTNNGSPYDDLDWINTKLADCLEGGTWDPSFWATYTGKTSTEIYKLLLEKLFNYY